jgi:hypothetical protein
MPRSKPRKNIKKSPNPLLFAVPGIALLALVVFLLLRQLPRPAAPAVATKITGSQPSGEDTFAEISRVSLAESKTAWDNGGAVFVDVREASAYAGSHIPGALSIPLAELVEHLGELDQAKWIITYCT